MNGFVNESANGTQVVSALSAAGTFSINTIGFFPEQNRTFFGEISEIIIYDRAISDIEHNSVGFYLANKYGLTTAYIPPPIIPDPTPSIPEPGTLALFGLGLAGLGFARRKKAA